VGAQALIFGAIVASTTTRVVAMGNLLPFVPRPRLRAFRVFHALRIGPMRSCIRTATHPPSLRGGWWVDTSLPCCPEGARWLASSPRRQDIELSTCCAVACSSSVRIFRWAHRSLGVAGSGSPRSRAVAVKMFWLARTKHERLSSSSTILWCTSWAMVRTRSPSPRRVISRSSSTRSSSS
jgi:hypothetical protein